MPKPPPRFSSPSTSPVAWCTCPSRPTTRCAAASKPAVSKICEPMWLCSPVSCSAGSRMTRTAAVSASPVASEKPNFWSSCAVAMNSWVCASMPTVARISTGTGAPPAATRAAASGSSRSISSKESTHDVADAGVDGQLRARPATCCCRAARSARRGSPAASARASSLPLQASRCRPSSAIQRATWPQRNAFDA